MVFKLINEICQDRWRPMEYTVTLVMAAFLAAAEAERRGRRPMPRNIPDRSNPLEVLSDRQVIDRYRIGRENIVFLCNLLADELRRPTARCPKDRSITP